MDDLKQQPMDKAELKTCWPNWVFIVVEIAGHAFGPAQNQHNGNRPNHC